MQVVNFLYTIVIIEMSCSIKRFKCDTYPEKIVNTENVKKLNSDLTKIMEERSKMDRVYFPAISAGTAMGSIGEIVGGAIIHTKELKKEKNE